MWPKRNWRTVGALCHDLFHNPKVGGSIPPPATNIRNSFKNLEENRRIELA
jgi:hypothetical protein